MIYVEYISRRAGIELADFHITVQRVQKAWESGHGADELILSAGRTWRLGPEPEYLGIWHTPGGSFKRLEEWAKAFRARGPVGDEATMSRVARIDFAGCYEALIPPQRARGGIYYVEQFRPAGADADIRALYEERAAGHPRLELNLLACRIGKLAPDPGALAVWTLPGFAALEQIARELDRMREPVELAVAGVYADIGEEIL